MRWLAVVLVVACGTPVAAPVEPEPITPVAVVAPPPDAPPPRPTFVRTRIVKIDVVGGDLIVTLAAGSDRGVSKHWTGCVLRESSDHCLPGGELEILRVEPGWTRTRLRATDVVPGHISAKLVAPP